MVEYSYEEAVALLESNLASALEKKVGGFRYCIWRYCRLFALGVLLGRAVAER